MFVICGFAFKVSAVPFHTWAPDTYEGAPTPVTAFLSVASKAAGFVALVTMVFLAFPGAEDVYGPLIWVLAALTMTIGNVLALRQTNIVRMLAYSSVSQGGFILMPLAFAGDPDASGSALNAVVVYLLVYAFMNLGAFAIVIAVSRKTRSGEITSFGGLFDYAPGLAVAMTIFMASLAGIPPLGGWFAKFNAFKAVVDAGSTSAYVLAGIAAANTVISAAYYFQVLRVVWMDEAPDGDTPDRLAAADRRRSRHHGHRHPGRRRVPAARGPSRRARCPHRRFLRVAGPEAAMTAFRRLVAAGRQLPRLRLVLPTSRSRADLFLG